MYGFLNFPEWWELDPANCKGILFLEQCKHKLKVAVALALKYSNGRLVKKYTYSLLIVAKKSFMTSPSKNCMPIV